MTCYFSGVVPIQQMEKIVSHLITCKKCKKKYKEYANKIGIKFNLIREIQKVYNLCEVNEMDASNINELIEAGIVAPQIVKSKKKWQQAAQERDITTLANLKCVSDFYNEVFNNASDTKEEEEAIAEFGWYKVTEMCKNVDTLNNLYKLSGGEEGNKDA